MPPTRRSFLGAVGAGVALGLAGCSDDDTTTTESPGGGDGPYNSGEPTTTPVATPTDDGGATGVTVAVATHPEYGDILVDGDGRTLYMFDADTNGESASACYDGCAQSWPPLTTTGPPSTGDAVTASVQTFERENGDRQVAAGGWPLYYFASDESPGDATGQGVNDVWWVLAPDGTPQRTTGGTTPTPAPTETPQDDGYY